MRSSSANSERSTKTQVLHRDHFLSKAIIAQRARFGKRFELLRVLPRSPKAAGGKGPVSASELRAGGGDCPGRQAKTV